MLQDLTCECMLRSSKSRASVLDVGSSDDEGFVWKKGRWFGMWKQRYLLRKGTLLFSFEADETTHKPILSSRDTFDLEHWRIERSTEKSEKRPFLLKLFSPVAKQSHLIATNTEDDMKRWLLVINRTRAITKFQVYQPQVIKVQRQIRMRLQRAPFLRLRDAAVFIQSTWKDKYATMQARTNYLAAKAKIVRCQSVVRRHQARSEYKRIIRRKFIVKELHSTETTYVTSIRTILELFANPLKAASQHPLTMILPLEELGVVFGCVEPICQMNGEFLAHLSPLIERWHMDQQIGQLFIDSAERFKWVYTPYALNYVEVSALLEKIKKKNPKFRDFLQAAADDGRSKHRDLASFLIQPIQRLPRYELLLKDLIRHTPKTHPDYESLNKGLQRVTEVTLYINEKKREKDDISAVTKLHSQLEGKLLETITWKPTYRLIREGDGQSSTNRKVNYIILLNELLLLTQKSKNTYQLREIIRFADVTVSVDTTATAENITFKREGEKACVTVPVVADRSPWSGDIYRCVVAKSLASSDMALEPRVERSGSVLVFRSSDFSSERSSTGLLAPPSPPSAGVPAPVPASPSPISTPASSPAASTDALTASPSNDTKRSSSQEPGKTFSDKVSGLKSSLFGAKIAADTTRPITVVVEESKE